MALIDNNYINESIPYLYKAYELDPTFYKPLVKISEIFIKQGKFPEANAYIDVLLKADPNNEDAFNKKADISYINNNIPEALELYEKVLNMNENNEDALLGKGICKHKMGDLDEAIKNYDKVIDINETNSNALYNKAVALLKKGDQKSVANLLKRAKKFDDATYILYAYGLNCLREKKYDTADEMFDLCIQKGEKTPEIFHAKGQALYGKGEYEQALQYISAASNAKPNYYVAWNSMANCLDKLGRKEEALSWYQYAAGSKPENALFIINYCVALLESGQEEKCKEYLAYVESFYQTQKDMFTPQEYEFIERCIKNMHDKLNNEKKNAKVVRLQPSEENYEESQ